VYNIIHNIIHYSCSGGGGDNLSHVKHSCAVSFVVHVDDGSCPRSVYNIICIVYIFMQYEYIYYIVYDVCLICARVSHQFKFNLEQRTPSAYCCGATFRAPWWQSTPCCMVTYGYCSVALILLYMIYLNTCVHARDSGMCNFNPCAPLKLRISRNNFQYHNSVWRYILAGLYYIIIIITIIILWRDPDGRTPRGNNSL